MIFAGRSTYVLFFCFLSVEGLESAAIGLESAAIAFALRFFLAAAAAAALAEAASAAAATALTLHAFVQ